MKCLLCKLNWLACGPVWWVTVCVRDVGFNGVARQEEIDPRERFMSGWEEHWPSRWWISPTAKSCMGYFIVWAGFQDLLFSVVLDQSVTGVKTGLKIKVSPFINAVDEKSRAEEKGDGRMHSSGWSLFRPYTHTVATLISLLLNEPWMMTSLPSASVIAEYLLK